ncbi:MAG: PQQ-dependent sugar dehydrogenase [Chitinophagales bacterium]
MRIFRAMARVMVVTLAIAFVVMSRTDLVQPVVKELGASDAAGAALSVPPDYRAELLARGLAAPVQVVTDERGGVLVAEAGQDGRTPRVVRVEGGRVSEVAAGFRAPLGGVALRQGRLFVLHGGRLTVIEGGGSRRDLVTGLPSLGDHGTTAPVFGPDGWLYFGQGTVTNSGVAGPDNAEWIARQPGLHDRPAKELVLVGHSFTSANLLAPDRQGIVKTGAFSPFGVPGYPGQVVRESARPSGALYRVRPDGSGLEVVAWGLRDPAGVAFDARGDLWTYNRSYQARGLRPVAGAPCELYKVRPGTWYGWPDYAAGEPLTLAKFKPKDGPAPQFLLREHPGKPPKPERVFPAGSGGGAFAFAPADFAPGGDLFLPLTGRVVRMGRTAGEPVDFLAGTAGRPDALVEPSSVAFAKGGVMYVTDRAAGTLWRITRLAKPVLARAPYQRRAERPAYDRFAALGPLGTFILGGLFGALVGAAALSTFRWRR